MEKEVLETGVGFLKSLLSKDDDKSEETPLLVGQNIQRYLSQSYVPPKPVEFVLAWKTTEDTSEKAEFRAIYEKHLTDDGLELTHVPPLGEHNFVLVHATQEILERYCEVMKMKMPIKYTPPGKPEKSTARKTSAWKQYLDTFIEFDDDEPSDKKVYTAEFTRDRRYLFDTENPRFFKVNERSIIIMYILESHEYNPDDHYARGISRMLDEGIYSAAYPLHDGNFLDTKTLRGKLLNEWASLKKITSVQPIDLVRAYFGTKYALYFAWLGFYTMMLVPAAIVGLICFFYGVGTMSSDFISNEICQADDVIMCPLCDQTCDYWRLSSTCTYAKVQYLFDNPATVFFAIFTAFWSTIFLELWKRHRSTLTTRWGLSNLDLSSEPPRSKYLSTLSKKHTKKKINKITGQEEPQVPFWTLRLPNMILSSSFMLLLLAAAIAGVVSTIVYRIATTSTAAVLNTDAPADQSTSGIFSVQAIASVINFICITGLGTIYDKAAVYLTELEMHRTSTEFENSLVLKTYFLQFVNTYASLFYIALIKGKVIGRPGEYNRIFGYRNEECAAGGCMMELCLQLLVIMTGKQVINAFNENIVPYFKRKSEKKLNLWRELNVASGQQYVEDYKLGDLGSSGLYDEYLEIVLQYGFVVIFIAAFPIAPFFALLNNMFEIRTDGQKLLKFFRRPIPQRANSIGVWFSILDSLNRLAALSNALIIAFTTNFIPRIVYYFVTPVDSEKGFLDFSLSYFNTSDFEPVSVPLNSAINPEICRYADYRYPPGTNKEYEPSRLYWHIMTARLAFVIVFETLVSWVSVGLDYAIPDVSEKAMEEMREEAYIVNKIVVEAEREKAKKKIAEGGD